MTIIYQRQPVLTPLKVKMRLNWFRGLRIVNESI